MLTAALLSVSALFVGCVLVALAEWAGAALLEYRRERVRRGPRAIVVWRD